jgi:hypothetical protein
MIRLRKIIDAIISAPLIGLATGVLCSGAIIGVMATNGCIPRDPHPERSPSLHISCANFSCR